MNSHPLDLDETDWAILRLLQDDARLSYSEIGRRVHLSQPAVAERVRALEEQDIITGYHASLNMSRIGRPVTAFIRVATGTTADAEQISALMRDFSEVLELHRVTGIDGVVLRVAAPSIARLNEILNTIGKVSVPVTSIVLESDWTRRTV